MSVGYAFLLSNGATSPWHKTRDLVDEPRYRQVWDSNTGLKVVAILRARAKDVWFVPGVRRPFFVVDWTAPCSPDFGSNRYGAHDDEFPRAVS